MGDEDGGLAEVAAQGEELLLQVETRDGIDRAERFIEQQHGGIGRQCAGYADTLALASGKLRGIARGELRGIESNLA